RGGVGIEIETARVSRREAGMSAFDVMLSESQERMLVVVRAGAEADVQRHFARWKLQADVIGRTTDDGVLRVLEGGRGQAELPVSLLTDEVPSYVREARAQRAPLRPPLPPEPADLGRTLVELLGSENICSRATAFSQYDSTVQANTVIGPGLDAALLKVPDTQLGLAVTTDSNPRYCAADPF